MTDTALRTGVPKTPSNSIFSHARYVMTENPVTGLTFVLFALIALCALIGPYIVPYDPLASDTCLLCGLGDFTDLGPGDLGAHIDFALGALPAGQSRSFVTYYGAAPDEWNALNALSMVGASIYSLGQSNWDGTGSPTSPSGAPTGTYGASTGEPATFMYGFVPRF